MSFATQAVHFNSARPLMAAAPSESLLLKQIPTTPNPMPSEALLRGQKIVEIEHNGYLYKLQATKLGKLILTK